jgi:hypothetical protein
MYLSYFGGNLKGLDQSKVSLRIPTKYIYIYIAFWNFSSERTDHVQALYQQFLHIAPHAQHGMSNNSLLH